MKTPKVCPVCNHSYYRNSKTNELECGCDTMNPIDFEPITMRVNATNRGGGIEIDLTTLGFPGERMAAYQNYLGGGLLGAVGVNDLRTQPSNAQKRVLKKFKLNLAVSKILCTFVL